MDGTGFGADPPQCTSTQGAAACDGHGSCDVASGTCHCQYFRVGPQCESTFADGVMPQWNLFVWCLAALHTVVILICAANLWQRLGVRGLGAGNLRDAAMACTMLACIVRGVWLFDPVAATDLFTEPTREILLKTPQVLWMVAMMLCVMVWNTVSESVYTVGGKGDATTGRKRRILLWFSIVVLVLVSASTSTAFAVGFHQQLARSLADGVFGVYAIVLMLLGTCFAVRTVRILFTSRKRSTSHRQRDQFTRAMDNTKCTITLSLLLGAVLLGTLAYMIGFDIEPHTNPDEYLLCLILIHGVVEGGAACTLVFACWQKPPLPFGRTLRLFAGRCCPWAQSWCSCLQVRDLEDELEGLTSMSPRSYRGTPKLSGRSPRAQSTPRTSPRAYREPYAAPRMHSTDDADGRHALYGAHVSSGRYSNMPPVDDRDTSIGNSSDTGPETARIPIPPRGGARSGARTVSGRAVSGVSGMSGDSELGLNSPGGVGSAVAWSPQTRDWPPQRSNSLGGAADMAVRGAGSSGDAAVMSIHHG